jgi:hypothetical protein
VIMYLSELGRRLRSATFVSEKCLRKEDAAGR